MNFKKLLSYCGMLIAACMYFFVVLDVIINPMNPDFNIDSKVLFATVVFVFMLILRVINQCKKIRNKKAVLFTALSVLIILQIIALKYLPVRYDVESWDMGVVFNAAHYYVNHCNFDMSKYDYFLWFPNNSSLYNIYVILFGFWKRMGIENIQITLNIFNAGLLLVSALFVEKTVQLIAGQEYSGIGTMLCVLLSPFSLYSVLAYTDTFSIIFLSAALYFYTRAIKNRGNYYINIIVFSLLVALGASLKVSVIILAIAALIDIVLRTDNIKQTAVAVLLVAAISFGGFSHIKYVNEHSPYLPEYDYNQTIPYTHWLMMGLNGLGGYCDDDYQLITLQYPDKYSRQQANITEIKKRIVEKGYVGMIYHIINKTSYIHSDGTFTACCSLDKAAVNGNELHQYVLCLGEKFQYMGYGSLSVMLSMFCIIVSGLFLAIFKKDNLMFMPAISLVGLTIFLLLWEAQPRYIINFLPVVVVMTAQCAKQIFDTIKSKNTDDVKI